ncbi:MAG: hypothetical protein H6983_26515 [Ectothiorhodospiraceae bacterium]|nr:hypothetical protein [Ectothiorhodospiraceae bacterium]MCP5157754.1 hypothetical protein [Ectothiorhodospiraceae bacterium]
MPRTARITVQQYGEITYGTWCPTCLLPSGVTVGVVLTDERERSTLCTGTYSGCLDCGEPIPVR